MKLGVTPGRGQQHSVGSPQLWSVSSLEIDLLIGRVNIRVQVRAYIAYPHHTLCIVTVPVSPLFTRGLAPGHTLVTPSSSGIGLKMYAAPAPTPMIHRRELG